jgi:hypothetical protein
MWQRVCHEPASIEQPAVFERPVSFDEGVAQIQPRIDQWPSCAFCFLKAVPFRFVAAGFSAPFQGMACEGPMLEWAYA